LTTSHTLIYLYVYVQSVHSYGRYHSIVLCFVISNHHVCHLFKRLNRSRATNGSERRKSETE